MKDFFELKKIYDKIFNDLNGYGISLIERNQRVDEYVVKDILYGETPFELIYALFSMDFLQKYFEKAKVFYDLGSGIGNITISAFLIKNFEKCCGVELLKSLYETSLEAKNRLINIDLTTKNKVQFINNNLIEQNFSDADIIYFSCPTKNEDLMNQIEKKIVDNLKTDTIIFSLIHVFNDKNNFELLSAKIVQSAWGETPMLIYRKK